MRKSWTFLQWHCSVGFILHFSPQFLGIGGWQASFWKTPTLNCLHCTKLLCSVLAQSGTSLDVVLGSKVLTRQPTLFEVVQHLKRANGASVRPYPFKDAWGIMRKWLDYVPGRGGAALPAALKPAVKKQIASVEHGLYFPGKACGSMKEELPLESTQANGKIEQVEMDKIPHSPNWFAQFFLLLFLCLHVTRVIKWQLQDCQQMIYQRRVLVACERNQYFSLLCICDCFFIISKFS